MFLKKINLKNKTALVTGAGKGIGKGCAIALAEAGANLIINLKSGDITYFLIMIKVKILLFWISN